MTNDGKSTRRQDGRRAKQTARPKPTSQVPLDDEGLYGTEPWRDINGVAFCHWDRWLLRLAIDEPEGLTSIALEFQRRTRSRRRVSDLPEPMLAQVTDLKRRLTELVLTPAEVLNAAERHSKWLRDRAFRRVWHATAAHRTEAMARTPRKVREARAREGGWHAFPVSPRPYFARLERLYHWGYFDYRGVSSVVLHLDLEGSEMLRLATSDDERLAIRRAVLGACVEAMAHVDDSLCTLCNHFREQEQQYLEAVRSHIERAGILRDLLELVTWEDYGLFHHVQDFLRTLPEPAANLAVGTLARIIADLREAELDYQLQKARSLRALVLASATPDEDDAL